MSQDLASSSKWPLPAFPRGHQHSPLQEEGMGSRGEEGVPGSLGSWAAGLRLAVQLQAAHRRLSVWAGMQGTAEEGASITSDSP